MSHNCLNTAFQNSDIDAVVRITQGTKNGKITEKQTYLIWQWSGAPSAELGAALLEALCVCTKQNPGQVLCDALHRLTNPINLHPFYLPFYTSIMAHLREDTSVLTVAHANSIFDGLDIFLNRCDAAAPGYHSVELFDVAYDAVGRLMPLEDAIALTLDTLKSDPKSLAIIGVLLAAYGGTCLTPLSALLKGLRAGYPGFSRDQREPFENTFLDRLSIDSAHESLLLLAELDLTGLRQKAPHLTYYSLLDQLR